MTNETATDGTRTGPAAPGGTDIRDVGIRDVGIRGAGAPNAGTGNVGTGNAGASAGEAGHDPWRRWVGQRERREEMLAPVIARRAAATLNLDESLLVSGAALPPLWHWFYFLAETATNELGPDGHPRRGGFLPPVDLPRRMFAGARLTCHQALQLGEPALRLGEVLKITEKRGASGRLVFVTVGYRIHQGDRLCVVEEQDIVYREAGGAPVPAPVPLAVWPAVAAGVGTQVVTPDPVLLFRFSALTFNAHRIHYDRPYALSQEGYPGLVVHGPLTAMLLCGFARAQVNRPLVRFSFRGVAPLFDLAPFRLIGTPAGDGVVELEAQGPDGRVALSARAEFG